MFDIAVAPATIVPTYTEKIHGAPGMATAFVISSTLMASCRLMLLGRSYLY